MKRLIIAFAATAALAVLAPSQPAHANGSGVAAGLIGGLAAGTIIGAAVAQPRYYYYEPAPVVVEGPPPGAPVASGCYWTRGAPVWDGWRGVWVRPRVQVCD
jgi:hypothetical protein